MKLARLPFRELLSSHLLSSQARSRNLPIHPQYKAEATSFSGSLLPLQYYPLVRTAAIHSSSSNREFNQLHPSTRPDTPSPDIEINMESYIEPA